MCVGECVGLLTLSSLSVFLLHHPDTHTDASLDLSLEELVFFFFSAAFSFRPLLCCRSRLARVGWCIHVHRYILLFVEYDEQQTVIKKTDYPYLGMSGAVISREMDHDYPLVHTLENEG